MGVKAWARLLMVSVCSQTRPGPVSCARKNPIAAKEHVADALDAGDVEANLALEHPDMPRVNPQRLARTQVVRNRFTTQLDPGLGAAAEALKNKSIAAEDACAEALLEADG